MKSLSLQVPGIPDYIFLEKEVWISPTETRCVTLVRLQTLSLVYLIGLQYGLNRGVENGVNCVGSPLERKVRCTYT